MGSLLIISIALSGLGWSSRIVCSKRGPDWACERGRWLVDHVWGWLGACGAAVEGDGASCVGTGVDVEERRVSGRARPWRARRASMTFNAELGVS